MSRFKSLMVTTVGLWAAEVVGWANTKLTPSEPLLAPEPDSEPSLEEKTRAVLDNLAVAKEFESLPSHLGLINVVAFQYPDGSRGLLETHEDKWAPGNPGLSLGYLVKPEGSAGPPLMPFMKSRGGVAQAVRTEEKMPDPEERASSDLGALVALTSQHIAEADRAEFHAEMLGFFQALLSGGQVIHSDLVHRCAYWLRRNGHVVKVNEIEP